MLRKKPKASADVCLILEGTYPYALGGVSTWTHELIQMQDHLTFSIVALASADAAAKLLYKLPENVTSLTTLRLQSLPKGHEALPPEDEKKLFTALEKALLRLQARADLDDLRAVTEALAPCRSRLGHRVLLDSNAAWVLLHDMYHSTMPKASFLDYFWSWRGLFGGLYSLLLTELPQAKVYHALCTGYAGLLMARAHLETGRPCVVTEHGIYTNERRIEIAGADWIGDPDAFSLAVGSAERELKDFWMDTFGNYSRFCYEAASKIVTLYEANQEFQLLDGAARDKLLVIPNGIDAERFDAITRKDHPPTVALIGRVVPIKDVKAYVRAVARLKESVPGLRAFMIGPTDEDPVYAKECVEMVAHHGLTETFIFTGKVAIEDYLGIIDVLVLTSLSEAQPLVILEAGAAGIPTVATDVGSCRELIMGGSGENPQLGAGGAVVPIGNSGAVAEELRKLLSDRAYYQSCSRAIKERVQRHYRKADQRDAYARLYRELMDGSESDISRAAA